MVGREGHAAAEVERPVRGLRIIEDRAKTWVSDVSVGAMDVGGESARQERVEMSTHHHKFGRLGDGSRAAKDAGSVNGAETLGRLEGDSSSGDGADGVAGAGGRRNSKI